MTTTTSPVTLAAANKGARAAQAAAAAIAAANNRDPRTGAVAAEKPAKAPAAAKAQKVPAEKKPAAEPQNCRCGCGAKNITAKATYLPGHDAKHAKKTLLSLIAIVAGFRGESSGEAQDAIARADEAIAALGSDKLRAKTERMFANSDWADAANDRGLTFSF